MKLSALILLFVGAVSACHGADFGGEWIAELSGGLTGEAQYSRVVLKADGSKLTGSWNGNSVEGTATGESLELTVLQGGRPVGSVRGALKGNEIAGQGTMPPPAFGGRGGGGRGGAGMDRQPVALKMARVTPRVGVAKTWDFEPKIFYGSYSAAWPPALKILPGDTVRTRTVDTVGKDRDTPRTPGGNVETGPFYIEGAIPGDTLVVKLNKVRVNRDTARSGSRMNGRALTPAYVESAEYTPNFDSEWKLDRVNRVAMLANPTEKLKNYKVPIVEMLGCIATAPPKGQEYRGTDLGVFGGNMDYNRMGEGVTLYLPVFNPGALLFFGDAHAAMGDGELTGAALETSVDVDFTVDLIKGYSTGNPRLENNDYIMSVGVAGSVPDAIQIATSQLAQWLKHDYKLTDSEIAIVTGTALVYDICELVDPHFSVVAKLPKRALAMLK